MMADLSPLPLLGLFIVGIIAGTIDAIAGGGGLLTVPGLMSMNISAIAALATNKVQSVCGAFSSTFHFWREGRIKLRDHWLQGLMSFTGAVAGAASLSLIDPAALKNVIPFLLIAIALWVLFSPKLGEISRKPRLPSRVHATTIVPIIGFYDGFLGPGVGTFFALSNVYCLGLKLDEATVRAKFYNAMSNLGALIFFLLGGHIIWAYGIAMALGQVIGGQIGAKLVLSKGTKLIKPLLVTVSLAISFKLLWQQGLIAKLF